MFLHTINKLIYARIKIHIQIFAPKHIIYLLIIISQPGQFKYIYIIIKIYVNNHI